jgi:hypothetical protein
MQEPMYPAKAPSDAKRGIPESSTHRNSPSARRRRYSTRNGRRSEGLIVGGQIPFEIRAMDTFGPTVPHLLLHGTPSELEPGLVEEVARLVNVRPPDQHRSRIRHQAEPFFALAQGAFDPSPSDTLNQQPRNQSRLPQEHCRRADNVEFVLIPQRWFTPAEAGLESPARTSR